MDRAGVVGEDGPTHHGLYDIAFLRTLPNIIITAPKDGNELHRLIKTGIESKKPFSIRYPKGGSISYDKNKEFDLIPIGKWEIINQGSNIAILAVGSMVDIGISVLKKLKENNIKATLINCRYIKPLDRMVLDSIHDEHNILFTLEEGTICGGFGSSILEYFSHSKKDLRIYLKALPDKFIQHASRDELLNDNGLDAESIFKYIKEKNEKE
tara:strand:+ start:48 stop:680 length:633 start_codon:yes stop_codon:yes gene_type:complete